MKEIKDKLENIVYSREIDEDELNELEKEDKIIEKSEIGKIKMMKGYKKEEKIRRIGKYRKKY